MMNHHPRIFWPLTIISYGLIVGAVYAWFSSKQWPLAASTLGTLLLFTFLIISVSYVSQETKQNTQSIRNNSEAIRGIAARELSAWSHRGEHPPHVGDNPVADPSKLSIRPVVEPPKPHAESPSKAEADMIERNRLIAQNTGELKKTTHNVKELNETVKEATEMRKTDPTP